jgi:uncharacterized protein (DUF3084 family)
MEVSFGYDFKEGTARHELSSVSCERADRRHDGKSAERREGRSRSAKVYDGRSESSMNKALSPWIWAVSRDVSKPYMTSRPRSEIAHFQRVGC